MGVASLVLGIVAVVFSFIPVVGAFIAIPCAVVGLPLGAVAFFRNKNEGKGFGMALTGIITSAGAIILAVVMAAAVFAAIGDGNVSNATDAELSKACTRLKSVGYDYWRLDPVAAGGRTMEVAANIHTSHTGPVETRKYCKDKIILAQ